MLYLKWNEECKAIEKLKEKIFVFLQDKRHFIATIIDLKEEVDHLNTKLEGITKFVRTLSLEDKSHLIATISEL